MQGNDTLKVRLADLKRVNALESVSDRRLRSLLPFCRKRLLPKNTVLFLEDEPAFHLYFLLEGSASVLLHVENGHRHTVYNVQPGQCLGWSALVPPYLYSATTQCTEPSLVVEVDGVGLRKLLAKDHKLAHILMATMARLISNRLHDTRRQLVEALQQRTPEAPRVPAMIGAE